jgi:hypothetical protein
MPKTFACPTIIGTVMLDANKIWMKRDAGYVLEILYSYSFVASSGGNILEHIHTTVGT